MSHTTRARRTAGTIALAAVAGGMMLPLVSISPAHAERVDLTSKYGYTSPDSGIFNILGGYDKPKAMKGDTDLAFCIEMGVYFPSSTTKVVKQVETDEYPEVAYVLNKWGDKKDNKNQAAVQYLVHKNLDVHDSGFKSEYGIGPGDTSKTSAEYEKARQAMLDGIDPSVKTLADKYWAEAEKNVGPYVATTPKITADSKSSGTGTISNITLKNAKGVSLDDQKVTVKISGDATFSDGSKSKSMTVADASKGVKYTMTKSTGSFNVSYATTDLPSAKLVIAQLGTHDGGDGYDGTGVYPEGNPAAGDHKMDRRGKPTQTSISAISTEAGATSKKATYEQESDLKTTATDAADGDKNVAHKDGIVKDTVKYSGLIGGKKYTMSGELMDKATGKSTGVKATKEFTADASGSGTVELQFKLPDSLRGKTLVAFETAEGDNGDVIVHADIDDEDQTVVVSDVVSKASDALDADNYIAQAGGAAKDELSYSGLTAGADSRVVSKLYDAETNEPLDVESETKFVPEKSSGKLTVDFKIPEGYGGKSILVTHTIFQGDVEQASDEHLVAADGDDEARQAETIHVSDLSTTALDSEDGDKNVTQKGGSITDTVKYSNFAPGQEYTVSGVLMDKETGESTGVTAEGKFTAEKSSGETEVVFKDLPADVAGKTLVVFETAKDADGNVVAEHTDIDDEKQTIYTANIGTTATDKLDGDKSIQQTGGTVVDEVKYHNLVPGKEYNIEGTLMDKSTKKPLMDKDGKPVTSSTKFTPEKSSGSVKLEFKLPDGAAGKTLVAFEKASNDVGVVATHEDIDDHDQTVEVIDVGTTATDQADGDKSVAHDGVVKDTVEYHNLVPGKEYVLKGELMDKETGKALMDSDGKPVKAEAKFKAKKADGKVDVLFDLKSVAGKTTVAFETLYDTDGNVLAEHKDINDKGQTVTTEDVPPTPEKPTTPPETPDTPVKPDTPVNPGSSVQTGGEAAGINPWILGGGALGAAAVAGGATLVYRVRRGKLVAEENGE